MPAIRRMCRTLHTGLSYANVMATVAVFIALGGGAYAAVGLPADSVGTSQIKRDAVTRSRLADDSVSTAQLAHSSVTLNRLSSGVRSLLTRNAPAVQGPAGVAGPAGAPGTRSFLAAGGDTSTYASGATLVSLAVPSNGLHILVGSVTLTNNGPDPLSGGCGLFNGARQLQAGNGISLNPGDTASLSLPGLDEVRDSTQPITMLCQFSGTGPVAGTAISLRAVRLEE
jgi:hypothetical protein